MNRDCQNGAVTHVGGVLRQVARQVVGWGCKVWNGRDLGIAADLVQALMGLPFVGRGAGWAILAGIEGAAGI